MIYTELLLEARTIITIFSLIFAMMILSDTRRIYRTPWAFTFIAIRCALALVLRIMLSMGLDLNPQIPEAIKTVSEILIVLTLISIWLGYGTVFDETPLRKFIRKIWPFK